MRLDDASTWSVDQLVAKLGQSSELFKAAGCKVENIPEAASLEELLKDNEVDGSTFLSLDSNSLKIGLGINNLGQRLALLAVIDLLRTQSVTHNQQITTDGVHALNLDDGREARTVPSTSAATTTTYVDANGRKRQKMTHITTAPLPASRKNNLLELTASDLKSGHMPTIDGNGEWDYLLRWEKADHHTEEPEDLMDDVDSDDEALSDLNEVVEEDDPQEPSDVIEGDEPLDPSGVVEDTEAVSGRSKLSVDQIVAIINERIAHYESIWFVNKGVLKGDEINYDPKKLWENAEANGQRQLLVDKHKNDEAYYKQRLDRYCKEIQKYAGNSPERLRQQCAVLEVTVNSMMLSRWLLSIYELQPIEEDLSNDEDEHMAEPIDDGLVNTGAQPSVPVRYPPTQTEIIDLGSPPESSQEIPDEVIVDSSPPPMDHNREQDSDASNLWHSADSFVAHTVEASANGASRPSIPSIPSVSPVVRPRTQQQHGDEPQNASIASARRWRWQDLVDQKDSKRCVTKAVQELANYDREMIRKRLETVGKADMIREIPACLRMLANSETRMQGVLARDLPRIVTFTRLFLCWWLRDNYFRLEPFKWHLEELQKCIEDESPDPRTFCDYLSTIMTTTFSPEALSHPDQPSQAEIVEISSDEDEPAPKSTTQRQERSQRIQASQHPHTIILD